MSFLTFRIMNMGIFNHAFCGDALCCGGHSALTAMFLEMGVDVRNPAVRKDFNEYLKVELGPDDTVIVDTCPESEEVLRGGFDYTGRHEEKAGSPFFLRLERMPRVHPNALIALAAMYAVMLIAPTETVPVLCIGIQRQRLLGER